MRSRQEVGKIWQENAYLFFAKFPWASTNTTRNTNALIIAMLISYASIDLYLILLSEYLFADLIPSVFAFNRVSRLKVLSALKNRKLAEKKIQSHCETLKSNKMNLNQEIVKYLCQLWGKIAFIAQIWSKLSEWSAELGLLRVARYFCWNNINFNKCLNYIKRTFKNQNDRVMKMRWLLARKDCKQACKIWEQP